MTCAIWYILLQCKIDFYSNTSMGTPHMLESSPL
jgi:hypothetical protein